MHHRTVSKCFSQSFADTTVLLAYISSSIRTSHLHHSCGARASPEITPSAGPFHPLPRGSAHRISTQFPVRFSATHFSRPEINCRASWRENNTVTIEVKCTPITRRHPDSSSNNVADTPRVWKANGEAILPPPRPHPHPNPHPTPSPSSC